MSYLDAISEPIGGVESRVVWDEDEQKSVVEREDDDSTDAAASPPMPGPLTPPR